MYLFIFLSFQLSPPTMVRLPPIRSNPHTPSLQDLLYRFRWLLVGCCVLTLNGGHLRPMHHVSLFFDVSLFSAPNRQTSHRAAKPEIRRLARDHRDPRRHWLGTPLLYPYRGQKPLEGRAPVDHFWCLWLFFSNLPMWFSLYVDFCSYH